MAKGFRQDAPLPRGELFRASQFLKQILRVLRPRRAAYTGEGVIDFRPMPRVEVEVDFARGTSSFSDLKDTFLRLFVHALGYRSVFEDHMEFDEVVWQLEKWHRYAVLKHATREWAPFARRCELCLLPTVCAETVRRLLTRAWFVMTKGVVKSNPRETVQEKIRRVGREARDLVERRGYMVLVNGEFDFTFDLKCQECGGASPVFVSGGINCLGDLKQVHDLIEHRCGCTSWPAWPDESILRINMKDEYWETRK